MNKDLLNILSNSNKDINNQQLMDYLAGKLSAAEAHEVERMMEENDLVKDAVEGLEAMQNEKKITSYVYQINVDLKNKTVKKQTTRQKRKLQEHPWIYLTLIIILVLLVLAYYIVHMFFLKN
jgi:anti-sigma factor RsiW